MYEKGEVKVQEFERDPISGWVAKGRAECLSLYQFLKSVQYVNSHGGQDWMVVFYAESKMKLTD